MAAMQGSTGQNATKTKDAQKTAFLIEQDAAESQRKARSIFERTFGAMSESSERATIFGLVSSAFGSGVLALPWVFGELGLFLGLIMLSFGGWMSLLSQRLLVNASYATGLDSYGGITVKMLGNCPSIGVDICLFLQCFGATCSYFVFLSQMIPELSVSLGGPEWLSSHDHAGRNTILLFAILGTPLSCLRSMAKLRYASMASTASLFIVAFLIMCMMPFRITELLAHEGSSHTLTWWMTPHIKKWQAAPVAAAISFFSFNCHCNLFGKYRELALPTARRVDKVLTKAVGIESFVYIAVGMCGYLSLGGTCDEAVPESPWPSCTPINVLASPRFGGAVGAIARICMTLTLNVSIPVHVAGGRDLFEQWFAKGHAIADSPAQPDQTESRPRLGSSPHLRQDHNCSPAQPPPQTPLVVHLLFCIGFLYLAAFCAIVYPELTSILSILGGFCCATFMFTVPMAVTLVLFFGQQRVVGIRLGPSGSLQIGTLQIGTFWGVTKLGTILAALASMVCIIFGYTSATLSLVNMVTGS